MRLAVLTLSFLAVSALAPVASGTIVATWEIIPGTISANDMSPDGRYVVGETDLNGDFYADGTYLWDSQTNTMTILPEEAVSAVAVSDDGTAVLGDIMNPEDPDPDLGVRAAIWRAATGWQSIGYLPNAGDCPSRSNGYELSADGTVAVGLSWDGCSGRGFRWTQETGMVQLQTLAFGANRASVLSADGNLIGGFAQGTASRTPSYWNGAGAGTLLDPNFNARGEVMGISDDGNIMLGTWATTESINRAVKWTFNGSGWTREMLGTGSMGAANQWMGVPMDIANNGTIVGFDFYLGNRIAWILIGGVPPYLDFKTYLINHGATLPSSEILPVCQAISTNGRYVIGHGYGAGWRATLDLLGDMNCDGFVNASDVDPFVRALIDPAGYQTDYPGCSAGHADLNRDGAVNGLDAAQMVAEVLAN